MREPLLTIGMATFDDFDGVYFTVTSLMIHHRDVMDRCRIVVVDNNPDSRQGRVTDEWVRGRVPNGTYYAYTDATGTAQARNEVFRQATTPAVLCIDCHVLLAPGAIERLLDYHSANPACRDLLTGPLLSDSGAVVATHQRPQWSRGAWGVWSRDARGMNADNPPFPIWQQGMGLFSCRRDAWVGFHPDFRGFGGCESYVMEKFRQRGGQVLCCPWLRWTHRFQRPNGVPYPILKQDRRRNYLIGFKELGLNPEPVHAAYAALESGRTNFAGPPSVKSTGREAFAVVGSARYGGVRMRCELLARDLRCKLVRPAQLPGMSLRDTVIAVKGGFDAREIRARCRRLILDPLDSFYSVKRGGDAVQYWQSLHDKLKFDDIIATSPACQELMRRALPAEVNVHLVPHQCDQRIDERWRDPAGPVVYAGLKSFVASGLGRIEDACRLIGKRFILATDCTQLRGASLVLSLRLPPWDDELNRCCKPQIKLENAAAAGLPAVSTDCPAARSRFPQIPVVPTDFTAIQLADAMRRALAGPGLSRPFRDIDYLEAMRQILDCSPSQTAGDESPRSTRVIYTAIFGDHDQLRDPVRTLPGTEYICFTDNPGLRSRTWKIRYCKPTDDPLMQAKRFKILAHDVLNCDSSIWVDGRIALDEPADVFEMLRADLGLVRHPERRCIYAEAEHCRRTGRGDPQRIQAAVRRYRNEGHPVDFGLWMGGVIVRRHTPEVARFNAAWWREVNRETARDQIVLPVVLRQVGIPFDTLPKSSLRFGIRGHWSDR